MQDKLFDMLLEQDDITWQSMIHDAVRTEQMDPWDIDIAVLAARFLEMLKKFKEMDFRISGKIVLAAAILLRIKSYRLVSEDLNQLDQLIAMGEQTEQDLYDELGYDFDKDIAPIEIDGEKFKLIPRSPQPRKRKVSVYDLVDALQKALEVKKRRFRPSDEIIMQIPKRTVDISLLINDVYGEIRDYFIIKKAEKLTFSQLLKSDAREDKIYTFIPLLHLSNQRKIDMNQDQHLSEIEITLAQEEPKEGTAQKE